MSATGLEPGAPARVRAAAADLARNLLAGARLVLFRRVSMLDFRVSPATFATLVNTAQSPVGPRPRLFKELYSI